MGRDTTMEGTQGASSDRGSGDGAALDALVGCPSYLGDVGVPMPTTPNSTFANQLLGC
jgi:hypothetical protein